MTGISNKPEGEEEARQEVTREHRAELLPEDQAGPKDHLDGKNRSEGVESRDRVSETGAGRGPVHKGH